MTPEQNNTTATIHTLIDETTNWFTSFLRFVMYPKQVETPGDFKPIQSPERLHQALSSLPNHNISLKEAQNLFDTLLNQAEKIFHRAKLLTEPPEFDDFSEILKTFDALSDMLRRLENDSVLENSGIDPFTGLRSISSLPDDLTKESERLARQGRQFSLALLRITGAQTIADNLGQNVLDRLILETAGLIKKSLRVYDDGYHVDQGEFVLCLKQCDIAGGIKGLERLKRELEQAGTSYKADDGSLIPLTLISCIAEPTPGEDLTQVIQNLRSDLDGTFENKNSVFEYMEMSALERFIKGEGA